MENSNKYLMWIAVAIVLAGASFLVYKRVYASDGNAVFYGSAPDCASDPKSCSLTTKK